MDSTEAITLYSLLYYIYNRFAVTFLMCFLGVLISQVLNIISSDFKKIAPVNVFSMSLQSVLVTVVMCSAQDYIEIKSFNTYVLCCVVMGIWSPVIIRVITNVKILKKFIINMSKKMKDPIIKAVGETIDQIEDETEDNNNNQEGA